MVFYFGGCAGGVWKTIDGGIYWQCVSDGFINTAAVGAIAVAPSDSNVIYAGTGETTIRIDVSHGDGVYKSTDAGRTWSTCRSEEQPFIGKIRVHPHNPDIVYVAALGHAFGPNASAASRSTDGGETWQKVLLSAATKRARSTSPSTRQPAHALRRDLGGAAQLLEHLAAAARAAACSAAPTAATPGRRSRASPACPTESWARSACRSRRPAPGRVWALVEAEGDKTGLYRSDDYGDALDQGRRPTAT